MKLLPPVLFGLTATLMGLTAAFVPDVVLLPWPLTLGGIGLMAAGGGLSIFAARHVFRQGTTVRPRQTPTLLVTDGPFRWTRNPMYLGLSGVLLGWAVVLGGVLPFLGVPLFVVAVDRLHIRVEEETLRQTFGAAYLAYSRQTRRWL